MNAARVELMASAVGKIGGVTWHHLFLLGTDASGKQSYLRAGPQCLPLESIAGRQGEFGDALGEYEPSPAGPYGVITFSSGAYEPGGVDFDPVAANVVLASGDAAAGLWEGLANAARALQDEEVPYDPIGTNANWASMELLRRCGAKPSLPPKRWAPGASLIAPAAATQDAATRRLGQATMVV
jgi:hypothetical protein